MSEILGNEQVINAILSGIGLVLTYFFTVLSKKYISKLDKEDYRRVLFDAASAGVQKTYNTYVRHRKKAAEDGKLTEAEKEQAMQKAKEQAIEYAKDQGVDILQEHGVPMLESAIEDMVSEKKAKAKAGKPDSK